ncbi:MAG: HAMP domain-containing histidine kinase [Proteobacteria bacterium]|nr:HAMP domain-containing histidine kinase [Pseudomonadota bacterium]
MPPAERRSLPDKIGHAATATGQALHSAWDTIEASLLPSAQTAWHTEAQLRVHRNGSRSSMMTMPAAAFLVALAFRPWVDFNTRLLWWAGVTALCLAIGYCNTRIDRMTGHDAGTVSRKSIYVTLLSVVFLTAWCSMGIFFWTSEPVAQMLLVLILACSMAGTIVVCASHPAIAASTLFIHAAFLIGCTALGGSELDHLLAALSAIFTVLMAGQLIALTAGVNQLLALEHERTGLVQNLRAAKRESDMERGRAQLAGRAKSQFLSHMNHELRTPMNAILGFSEIIQAKSFGSDVDKYAEYAAIIHDSGEHLLSLIDGMLDLAKIDAGRLSLRETEVDVARLIGDAIEAENEIARQARITLTGKYARELPRVFADERGLRQIVVNLLSNAIKFTQAEGHVTVFAHVEPDGSFALGVADTGIGIAREDKDHIFERFGRGRHEVTEQLKGVGLGLAVVKGFAEAHDGKVLLESEIGDGTCVTVLLPKNRVLGSPAQRLAG